MEAPLQVPMQDAGLHQSPLQLAPFEQQFEMQDNQSFWGYGQGPDALDRGQNVVYQADRLAGVPCVKVQEKRQMIQAVTGIEQNGTYVVSTMDNKPLFVVQENSDWCERCCFCCCPDCKPWRMDLYSVDDESWVDKKLGVPFLHLERPFACLCCCFCKPNVEVSEPHGTILGKVREPRTRCSYSYMAMDTRGSHILNSSPDCCQLGRFCSCPGFQVTFPITDVSDMRVAEVRKTWTKGDCCPCCFEDWNKYTVEFGQDASSEVKLLLVSMALVVQMRHFNSR